MKIKPESVLLLFVLLFIPALTHAQQQQSLIFPITDRLPPPTDAQNKPEQEEEEEFVKPSRPTVAKPTEFQKPGVLQVEIGYDANYRGEDFDTRQSVPLALRFAASKRLLLEINLDAVKSETDLDGQRITGVGDTQLGFQVVAVESNESRPALGFAYYVKLPTASEEKGLGSGRFDHKILGLVGHKFGETNIDFNAAFLVQGREGESGWDHGGQAALAVSHQFQNNWGIIGEISGQSLDEAQPRGVYALGALTHQVNRRFIVDAGMRFGLNPSAPRIGVFAGMTVGVFDFFKHKR
ncbi:MAG TPA: transporter [Pyrinomonadaceae bacterium]|jgi:hypothetical protein